MIEVAPFGDRALVVRFNEEPSDALSRFLAAFAKGAATLEGVIDAAPGHQTVVVEAAPAHQERLTEELMLLQIDAHPQAGALHSVPLKYDGEDIDWVCRHLDMSRDELAAVHSRPTYKVRLIGSPGFIYLSSVAPMLTTPRLDEPRTMVPQGSVGIAGIQTGIYGRPRPGGWRLIATATDIPPMKPGDEVKFVT